MSYSVSIQNVVKEYGNFRAVNGVSLEVNAGEFFTLLGPSGCGKTTLLRMIAGFNSIEEGEIYFGDKLINNVPAHKRDIGMVFQNYAIFPHMSVGDNVAYGLKERKVPAKEREERVRMALRQVQIEDLIKRIPNALSGGQQQRVALARAFVIEPNILLMDEPLSNLDAKLRVQMRGMIKKLQSELGITTIYVTHDQEEALAISDRIAVMKDGKVMQVGRPEEIYRKPENLFVANFIGTTNQLPGKIIRSEDKNCDLLQINGELEMPIKTRRNFRGDVTATIRPEHVRFSESGVAGTVSTATFLGGYISYEIELANGRCVCVNEYGNTEHIYRTGERVHLNFPEKCVAAYADTGEVVTL